jgi:hypothetical protein
MVKTVTVTLTKRELTHIRVGLLRRMDSLKDAIDKTAGQADGGFGVRADCQVSYEEIKALMYGKLWAAVKELSNG